MFCHKTTQQNAKNQYIQFVFLEKNFKSFIVCILHTKFHHNFKRKLPIIKIAHCDHQEYNDSFYGLLTCFLNASECVARLESTSEMYWTTSSIVQSLGSADSLRGGLLSVVELAIQYKAPYLPYDIIHRDASFIQLNLNCIQN